MPRYFSRSLHVEEVHAMPRITFHIRYSRFAIPVCKSEETMAIVLEYLVQKPDSSECYIVNETVGTSLALQVSSFEERVFLIMLTTQQRYK